MRTELGFMRFELTVVCVLVVVMGGVMGHLGLSCDLDKGRFHLRSVAQMKGLGVAFDVNEGAQGELEPVTWDESLEFSFSKRYGYQQDDSVSNHPVLYYYDVNPETACEEELVYVTLTYEQETKTVQLSDDDHCVPIQLPAPKVQEEIDTEMQNNVNRSHQ